MIYFGMSYFFVQKRNGHFRDHSFFCKKEGKEDEKGTNYKVDGKFVYCDGFFGSCSNIRIDKFYMLPFFVSAGITGRCRKITS